MNKGLAKYNPVDIPLNIQQMPTGVSVEDAELRARRENLCAGEFHRRDAVPDGKYLVRSRGTEKSTSSGCRESEAIRRPLHRRG